MLSLLITFLVSRPTIQTWIVGKVTDELTELLGVEARIGEVEIHFITDLSLGGIYLEDQAGDTLLSVEKLGVEIGFWSLTPGLFELDEVFLEDAVIRLSQSEDSVFNFQFLIDEFAPEETEEDTTAPTEFELDVNHILLTNIDFKLNDQFGGYRMGAGFDSLDVKIEKLSLLDESVRVESIFLDRFRMALVQLEKVEEKPLTNSSEVPESVEFPATGWDIGLAEFLIQESEILFQDKTVDLVQQGFDPANVKLTNLGLQLSNLSMNDEQISVQLMDFNLRERSGLDIRQFGMAVTLDSTALTVDQLQLETPASSLKGDVSLDFESFNDLILFNEKVDFNLGINAFHVGLADLNSFDPTLLDSLGANISDGVSIHGKLDVSGNLSSVNLNDVQVGIGEHNSVELSGKVDQPAIPDSLHFSISPLSLQLLPSELAEIIDSVITPEMLALEPINLKATLAGTLTDLNAMFDLSTALGSANLNLKAQPNSTFNNGKYSGAIRLKNFDPGPMAGMEEELGPISMDLNFDGEGFDPDSLELQAEMVVSSAELMQHIYENLVLDMELKAGDLSLNTSLEDPNLHFDLAILGEPISADPTMNLSLNLKQFAPGKLNLTETPIRLKTLLDVELEGFDPSQLSAGVLFQNLQISNDTLSHFIPEFKLNLEASDSATSILAKSDFLDVEIKGKFNPATIGSSFEQMVDAHFPIAAQRNQKIEDDDFNLQFAFNPPIDLMAIAGFPMSLGSPLQLNLQTDFTKRELNLNGGFRNVNAAGLEIGVFDLSGTVNDSKFQLDLNIDSLGDGLSEIATSAGFHITLENDSLNVETSVHGDSSSQLLFLAMDIRHVDQSFFTHIPKPIIINGSSWAIDQTNQVEYYQGQINFHGISLENGEQKIVVQRPEKGGVTDFELILETVGLSDFAGLAGLSDPSISGELSGQLTVIDPTNEMSVKAEIQVDKLMLDSLKVGSVISRVDMKGDMLEVFLNVKDETELLLLEGNYNLATTALDFDVDIPGLNLAPYGVFVEESIRDLEGVLSGNLELKGTVEAPSITGRIGLKEAAMQVNDLNMRYAIPDASIRFKPNELLFEHFITQDSLKNTFQLSGGIQHTNFDDIVLDLGLATERFRLMNTHFDPEEAVSGTLDLALNGTVKGPIDLPVVNMNAKTLEGSDLTVVSVENEPTLVQEDFIIFGNPEELESDSSALDLLDEIESANPTGLDITLNLELTPDMGLRIVIDPSTGDQVICKGAANLAVELNPAGDLNVTGSLEIVEGKYDFSFEGLVEKEFQIQPNSRIDFSGDPMDARLNLTAIYETKTQTYDFIAGTSTGLSADEEKDAKLRAPVQVKMIIAGNLSNPDLSFDIGFPDAYQSSSRSLVEQKVASIRNHESELYKQVFGLILFGSFITDESSTASTDLTESGEAILISSVSNLITQQLNNLADKYVNGIDISMNLESYQSDFDSDESVTDLQLALSKQLFNDRLTISAGSNIGLTTNENEDISKEDLTGITGDFVIEYKLTESGKYRVKVFNRNDYDPLNDSNANETGIGVFYVESFDRIGKKKKEESK